MGEGESYQLEMMRCLREINVDNNTVGWWVQAGRVRAGGGAHNVRWAGSLTGWLAAWLPGCLADFLAVFVWSACMTDRPTDPLPPTLPLIRCHSHACSHAAVAGTSRPPAAPSRWWRSLRRL